LRLFRVFLFVGSLRHVAQSAFDISLQVLFVIGVVDVVDVVDVIDVVGVVDVVDVVDVVGRCRRSVVDVPHFDVGRSGEAHSRLSTFVGVRLSTFVGVRHARPLGDVDALLDLSDCCLVNIKDVKMCVRKRQTETERDIERKRKRDTIVARRGEMGGGRQLVHPLKGFF
jgi:hypothetical protein